MDAIWHELLGAGRPLPAQHDDGRVQIAETPAATWAEGAVHICARGSDGPLSAPIELILIRRGAALHGVIDLVGSGPDPAGHEPAIGDMALVWRGAIRCAGSLRLASLTIVAADGVSTVADRRELQHAASLAESLEIERAGRTSMHRRWPDDVRCRTPQPGRPHPIRLEVPRRLPRWKRATDLGLGAVAAIAATPVAAACAILVRCSGPGPIVFRQVRVGSGGLPFQVWKFRTMHVGNDDREQRIQNRRELLGLTDGAKVGEDRVTPVGRWLRRLSLDELPQLANVLRGEMSLVGPRPSLLWEVELFASRARRRLRVRPGVTGLWQTMGRGDVSMLEMLELDLAYVDSVSAWTDARCLAATARSVLDGEGAA